MDNQNLALETKTDLMLSKEYAERRELSSRLRKVILALSRGQRQLRCIISASWIYPKLPGFLTAARTR